MSKYTKNEKNEFDRLVRNTASPDQVTRIMARLSLRKFVSLHGKDKCDAMFADTGSDGGK